MLVLITISVLVLIGIAACLCLILLPKSNIYYRKKKKPHQKIEYTYTSPENTKKVSDIANSALKVYDNGSELINDGIEEAVEYTPKSTIENYTKYPTTAIYDSNLNSVMHWIVPSWDRDPDFIKRNLHNWHKYIQYYVDDEKCLQYLDSKNSKMNSIAYVKETDMLYIWDGKKWGEYTKDNYKKYNNENCK